MSETKKTYGWVTRELFEAVDQKMTAAGINPFNRKPTPYSGEWEAEHLDSSVQNLRDIYTKAGFVVDDIEHDYDEENSLAAIVRFRLPDATEAAPLPRYYVDNSELFHFIRDREHLNKEGKHRIVEAMFTRVAADAKVNELNTANTAPIEAPATQSATTEASYLWIATASGHSNSKEILVRAPDPVVAEDRAKKALALKHSGVEVDRVYTWREVQIFIEIVEAQQHPVLTALKALRVDAMSPLEAITKLGELQRMLGQE